MLSCGQRTQTQSTTNQEGQTANPNNPTITTIEETLWGSFTTRYDFTDAMIYHFTNDNECQITYIGTGRPTTTVTYKYQVNGNRVTIIPFKDHNEKIMNYIIDFESNIIYAANNPAEKFKRLY
jgi:hypothetical protein